VSRQPLWLGSGSKPPPAVLPLSNAELPRSRIPASAGPSFVSALIPHLDGWDLFQPPETTPTLPASAGPQSRRACLSIQDHAVPPPRPPMWLLGPWVTREAIGVPSRPPDSGSPPQSAS
jgi:hypothetical protein